MKKEEGSLCLACYSSFEMIGEEHCPNCYKKGVSSSCQDCQLWCKEGIEVNVEIMIPLVGLEKELAVLREQIVELVEKEIQLYNAEFKYKVGTMIEIPRACLIADKIAEHADFFSFGTNDLTQLTFGYSRDDAEKFIDIYKKKNILESDPFVHLDDSGVLELMKLAVEKAKTTKPGIKLGICGEHGGDERSILLCSK